MNPNNSKAFDLWNSKWTPETHTTDYATKRIQSARSSKLTPVKIDAEDMYGYFQGSHGRYETFLDNCPCGDFRRSKLPCKHIYRLAIELGVLDVTAESNVNSIPTPNNERISLDDTINIIESLSKDAQLALYDIARSVNSTDPSRLVNYDENIIELLKSNIIIDLTPQEHSIDFGTKAELCAFLDSINIPYKKSVARSVLIELCEKYAPEKAAQEFGELTYVTIPTTFRIQKIHFYLNRKYFPDHDIDGNICMPDDDITNQLIKRGYYTANGNIYSIPTPQNECIELDKTIDIIETLSESAQHTLLSIAGSITSTSSSYLANFNEDIIELLKSGLIIDLNPKDHLVNFGKKADVRAFLDSLNIPYKKNDVVAVLEDLCLEHAHEKAVQRFGELTYVTIPTKFFIKKIHYYLHRKYDSEYFLSGGDAQNIYLSPVPLLETDLPDDDVTDQLIKRGYYSRKTSL